MLVIMIMVIVMRIGGSAGRLPEVMVSGNSGQGRTIDTVIAVDSGIDLQRAMRMSMDDAVHRAEHGDQHQSQGQVGTQGLPDGGAEVHAFNHRRIVTCRRLAQRLTRSAKVLRNFATLGPATATQ
jgi:hypothetical protein